MTAEWLELRPAARNNRVPALAACAAAASSIALLPTPASGQDELC
jgi:hypothetical protein